MCIRDRLLGDNVEGLAKELGGYGADEVIVCESPLLKNYTTDAYTKVICDMIEQFKPEAFLIGETNICLLYTSRAQRRSDPGGFQDRQRHVQSLLQ